MVRDGAALERLAEIDTVIFDKTGTLTTGLATPIASAGSAEAQAMAASLAARSRHPYSLAIARSIRSAPDIAWTDVKEEPGLGIEARHDGQLYRLGRANWSNPAETGEAGTVFSRDGISLAAFTFADQFRPHAAESVKALLDEQLHVEILSGDRDTLVEGMGAKLGIAARGSLLPGDKFHRIEAIEASGHRVLMVGDGLNDTPAMARAHASMAPGSAIDIGRNAADLVFMKNDLHAIPTAIAIAREANRLIRQNLALALLYNAIALPVALAGFVNPFLAAIAMSASSVVVVANALRLGWCPFVRNEAICHLQGQTA
jgi:Cu2+-exporting ATPase